MKHAPDYTKTTDLYYNLPSASMLLLELSSIWGKEGDREIKKQKDTGKRSRERKNIIATAYQDQVLIRLETEVEEVRVIVQYKMIHKEYNSKMQKMLQR